MRLALARLALILLAAACSEGEAYEFAGPVALDGDAITAPLDGKTGDAARGLEIFVSREEGHCVLCHAIEGLDAEFQGNVGPELTGLADRLTPGEIRLRIAGAQKIWPDTLMPSYYTTEGLNRVAPEYQDAPALSAQQIEDLVAYLSGLKA
ncbi:MAG: sulfur oxidation c-type cytochrome SoxX [Henriciella sp.]|uniref:sulfur oxidation c-type cytochrome SoxX n=1 Tax=Henriciella sp. TaxID=1968823 RepID=UPI003C78EDB3